jgi:hypothetical protein
MRKSSVCDLVKLRTLQSTIRIQKIPLADQFRRRPAKPQKLVQLQHGIPAFARSGARAKAAAPKFLSFRNEGGLVTYSRCKLRLGRPISGMPNSDSARTGFSMSVNTPIRRSALQFFATRIPVPVMTSQAWRRRFNSAFASRSLRMATRGLQALTVKSRLLTGEKCLRTATTCESAATRHFSKAKG